ncbi:hypothetical protein F1D05_18605 [Kribbella qitaiheensis]|uniref:Uncharacterized protein n=1 Tax=Kribbella qitaiheensis TaxID=1544730 RepID=A0A7G6WZZ7_9ACTN|nr:hypothetical protein [Kribbella qitaiheensis]QNE19562.1 hypothetical protein F1D05_18605 [Kribbella qitaiheensis]
MSDQYGDPPPPRDEDRPGPYGGVFGQSGSSALPPVPRGGAPSPYGGSFGRPNPYSQLHSGPPKQVTIASVIALALGVLSVLLGLFALTSAGAPIAKMLTGDENARGVILVAALLSSAAYFLPAIFLRNQRPWARTMLIVVAAFGIAGSVSALPGGLLGLALHVALLVLMLQTPTKLWFAEARR